jgi:antitoxin component YwqK of YwqJK toxin-antitoxin module
MLLIKDINTISVVVVMEWLEDLAVEKLRSGIAINGLKEGYRLLRYPNSSTKILWYYINGQQHGVQRAWYINGQLYYEWNYTDGVPHGLQTTYYDDGHVDYNYTCWHGSAMDLY